MLRALCGALDVRLRAVSSPNAELCMRISHLWCLWHINWRAAQLPVGGTCTGAAVVLAAFVQVVSPVFMPACSVLSSTMLFLAHILGCFWFYTAALVGCDRNCNHTPP